MQGLVFHCPPEYHSLLLAHLRRDGERYGFPLVGVYLTFRNQWRLPNS